MKKINKYLSLMFFLFFGIIIAFFSINQVLAQNISFTVFPAIQDLKIKPGEKTRGQIQFRNASDNVINGQIKVADFIVKDQTGTPLLIEPTQTSKYSAASWFSLNQDFVTIPPRDFVTIDFTINAPKEIATCSRHSIIYLEPIAYTFNNKTVTKTESVSQLSAQLGGLINLLVEKNKCKENLQIIDIKIPNFLEYGPIPVFFSILNLSDFYINPKGAIVLLNPFNQVIDQKIIEDYKIFPEVKREFSQKLGEKLMIGRYKILIKAASNGKNSVSKESIIYTWVFPWKIILVIILSIIILILLIRHFYQSTVHKEKILEEEIEKEKEEIEKLKEQLKKRNE